MLEAVWNVVARRSYVVVSTALPYRLVGTAIIVDGGVKSETALRNSPRFVRLTRAVDEAVDRTVADLHGDTWHVIALSSAPARLVWPHRDGEDDGNESVVPRRPRHPLDSDAIALELPSDTDAP